jgi:hypothetical protein
VVGLLACQYIIVPVSVNLIAKTEVGHGAEEEIMKYEE